MTRSPALAAGPETSHMEETRAATQRPLHAKKEPPWRVNDAKAQKSGQRGTIYWVGRSIIGEDGSRTGDHQKGASYQGEWHDNRKNGYGVQVYPNREKYEGQWGDGLRNGEGTLWVPIGASGKLRKLYVGGWKDDRRHGRGTCFFKDGEFFQGTWDQGQMNGNGTLRYSNGDLYIGEWHDGQRSGHGTLHKANGDSYEGHWLGDKREGSGSHFYAESGKVFVGEWAGDLPKAGVYTQARPNPEQAAAVPVTSQLPPVRLALPSEVLEGALAAVRNDRRAFRVRTTPVHGLFAEEEAAALRQALDGARRVDGLVNAVDLQGLGAQLGAEISDVRLQRLLQDVGAPEQDAEGVLALKTEDFLRFVALLLDEEAAVQEASPSNGQADLGQSFWPPGLRR